MWLGCSSISIISLVIQSTYSSLETILVSCKLDVMFSVEHVLFHCQLIQLCEVIVTVEIFFFGLNQPAALHNIDLTSSAHSVHTWSLQTQAVLHRVNEARDLLIFPFIMSKFTLITY